MSATDKQKQILRELGASHMSLYRFFGSETQVNHQRMERLLRLLQEHTRPVRPELLGVIGEDHLRRMIADAGGEPKSFKYFAGPGQTSTACPYMIEIAICPYNNGSLAKTKRGIGNWSPASISAPRWKIRSTPSGAWRAWTRSWPNCAPGAYAPVIVCVHYACPHIEYLDRGKSRIGLE